MSAEFDEDVVKEWLDKHEHFTKSYIENYLFINPTYARFLTQKLSDEDQLPYISNDIKTTYSLTLPYTPKLNRSKSLVPTKSSPSLPLVQPSPKKLTSSELRKLNQQEMFMELLRDVVSSANNDVNRLSHKILVNILLLTNADRSSLFLVEGPPENPILVSRLFDVTEHSTLEEVVHTDSDALRIPMGVGIVGAVAESGTKINIVDAYQVKADITVRSKK